MNNDPQELTLMPENDNENSQTIAESATEKYIIPDKNFIDNSKIIQEDDEPLDSIFQEKLQRLLTSCLYAYNFPNKLHFMVCSNVGIFFNDKEPPLVPDVFLSLNVTIPDDYVERNILSYLVWEFGKLPEIVIEMISPNDGEEMGIKFKKYAYLGVKYYVVYDPQQIYSSQLLHIFELENGHYVPLKNNRNWFPELDLGLTLWSGTFETGYRSSWLRWCDENGTLIPTSEELAFSLAQKQAELARKQAELAQRKTELSQRKTELS